MKMRNNLINEYNEILFDELEGLRAENDKIRRKHCELIREYNILQQKCNKKIDDKSECNNLRETIKSMIYKQDI